MKKFAVGLGFSSECNMNCKFCYSKNKRNAGNDINIQQWFRFFERNHQHINSVNYGTGENSTSSEWYDLITYVRNYYPDIKQAVTTNGYLSKVMNKDTTKRHLVIQSIDEVDVSLDFGNEKTHNEYRGNSNAFKWAIDTLGFCRDNNILPTIVTLGIDETLQINNMEKIFDIAFMYNAKVRVNLYRPVNKNINIKPTGLNVILEFIEWANKYHKILSLSDPLFSTLLCGGKAQDDPSGEVSIRITQDGNIYPSTYLLFDEFVMGNIENFRLATDLEQNDAINKILNARLPSECIKCIYAKICKGGVIDRRYIWYGTLEKRDPYCFVEKRENHRTYRQNRTQFVSVHDGYLPTLFFQS